MPLRAWRVRLLGMLESLLERGPCASEAGVGGLRCLAGRHGLRCGTVVRDVEYAELDAMRRR